MLAPAGHSGHNRSQKPNEVALAADTLQLTERQDSGILLVAHSAALAGWWVRASTVLIAPPWSARRSSNIRSYYAFLKHGL